MAHAFAVRPVEAHGRVRVGDGDNAADQRDLIALQAAGVAGAVVALVVAGDGLEHLFELRNLADQHFADRDVPLHDRVLLGVERCGLLQDLIGHGEFANVVQQAGDAEGALRLFGQVEPHGELDGVFGDDVAVRLRVAVLRIDRLHQAIEHAKRGVACGSDGAPATADPSLRRIHRRIGRRDDLRRRIAIIGEAGDAERHADGHEGVLVAAELRPTEAIGDLLRHGSCGCFVQPRQDDQELIAAIAAGDAVHRLGAMARDIRGKLEDVVSHNVAVRVVEELEPVDVAHEKGEGDALGFCGSERCLDRLQRAAVVEQACKCIGARLLPLDLHHAFKSRCVLLQAQMRLHEVAVRAHFIERVRRVFGERAQDGDLFFGQPVERRIDRRYRADDLGRPPQHVDVLGDRRDLLFEPLVAADAYEALQHDRQRRQRRVDELQQRLDGARRPGAAQDQHLRPAIGGRHQPCHVVAQLLVRRAGDVGHVAIDDVEGDRHAELHQTLLQVSQCVVRIALRLVADARAVVRALLSVEQQRAHRARLSADERHGADQRILRRGVLSRAQGEFRQGRERLYRQTGYLRMQYRPCCHVSFGRAVAKLRCVPRMARWIRRADYPI